MGKSSALAHPIPFPPSLRTAWIATEPEQSRALGLCVPRAAPPHCPGRALGNPTYSSCLQTTGHLDHSDHITPMVTVCVDSSVPLCEPRVGEWHHFSFLTKLKIWIHRLYLFFQQFLALLYSSVPLKPTLPFLCFLFLWEFYFEC